MSALKSAVRSGRHHPFRWVLARAIVAGLAAASPVGADAQTPPRVQPDFPTTATNLVNKVANTSPVIAVDPTDRRFMVLAHRVDGPDFSCGLQVSGDGGRGWIPAVPVPKLPEGAEKCYAPEVAFDAKGTLYYLFIGLAGPGNSPMGVYISVSKTKGATFSAPRQVLPGERYMVRMAIDPSIGAQGRMHLVWLEARSDPPLGGLAPPPNPIMAAYSDDGGRTFSTARQISDPQRPHAVAPALALGPDHAVHVVYYDLVDDARDYQGLEGPPWDGTWSLVMASSSDGGRTFSRGVVVDDDIVPPERVMLIFTMPPASVVADKEGRVFVAWHDARNDDWDIFLRRSRDAGVTWDAVRRINDDKIKNGLHQFLPRLALSPDGRLDAVFYDRRGNVENRGNDVYYTSSKDAGASFARNVKLTRVDSDSLVGYQYGVASAQGLYEWGSRLGLVAERGRALAAWTDSRNTARWRVPQDIYAAEVDLGGGGESSRAPVTVAVVAVAAGAGALALRRRRQGAHLSPEGPVVTNDPSVTGEDG
ncbi:MAG TPA: sialidase family protein [Acidimicrobiales bacterium]|nr:sialidase family protein [Acidimicrobiales bacterium]